MEALRRFFSGRPTWANALLAFCTFMTFVYMPYDFFWKPVAQDQEVWFGLTLHGWAAKLTEPLHWAIYAAGAYGFYHMRSWLWPWASLYVAQIALGMLVWSALDERASVVAGSIAALVFGGVAFGLWQARGRFSGRRPLAIANERV